MKVGDLIINPFVEKNLYGKPNPLYITMVVRISSSKVKCLSYKGDIIVYYKNSAEKYKVISHVDIKDLILKEYGKCNEKEDKQDDIRRSSCNN